MKKYSLFIAFFTAIFCAQAQEILDTVQVISNHVPSDLQTATRKIDVLSKNDIENSAAVSANEVLESVSSLDVRQRAPFGVQADISVRGGTFDQTLILLNGIRINDPQTGHHNMNLPVSLDLIEQIEVLEGGATRIYGPNAFAGAINFQTPTKGKNQLFLKSYGGAYGLFGANLSAAFNTGKFYTIVAGDYSQSDGYINNTDFKNTNLYAQTTGKTKVGTLMLAGGFNKKGFGAQNFYSSRYPEQFEATQTIFAVAKLSGGDLWKYTVSANWRQHNDQFELFREDKSHYQYSNGFFVKTNGDTASYAPGAYYPGHNYHQTRVFGTDGNISRKWNKAGTTTLGFDYRNEQILSNNLGKTMNETISIHGSRGVYTKSDVRDNYAFFIEHVFTYKKWLVTAGVLGNYNTAFGEDLMPGIDVGYRVKENVLLFGSVDRSFRLPTFTDLYYNLGGARGSQDLQPEYSMNYEVGARYSKGIFGADVAVFRREGKNMIDWIQWKSDSIHAENLTEVAMNGVSVSTNMFLATKTNGWINKLSVSYTYLVSDQKQSELQSIYVLDYLQSKLTVGVNHKIFLKNLTANWSVNYQKRNGDYLDFASNTTVNYEPFVLVDAKLNYAFSKANVFVSAYNLFNVNYVDRGNVAQPGIWLSGGFSVKL